MRFTEKEIKNFPGYVITDNGKVISYKFKKPRVMKTWLQKSGYENIKLCKENHTYHFLIHRLVAEAFIPNPENKATVNHIDCNRHNNNVKNLEWATYRENNDYALKVMREQGENKRNNKASKPIIQYDLEMNFIAEYPSVREAERQLGYKGICACLVGKQKTVHGHIFKYKQL